MGSRGVKSTFLYELPSPCTSPIISTRNTMKNQAPDAKQDKIAKRMAEWPHDHQPPSSFYNSTRSSCDKKIKRQSSQDSVPATQTEDSDFVPCSLAQSDGVARQQRFSPRLVQKDRERVRQGRKATSSKERVNIAVRTLERSIHKNDLQIEQTEEHKMILMKEIKQLQDRVAQDESVIRTYKRANMQLKTQREELRKRAFDMNYRG
jgi:hypothetical protein